MMMMMLNCFYGVVDRQKWCSFISNRSHYQRFSPLQISDTPPARFDPVQDLSSTLAKLGCTVVKTTVLRCHRKKVITKCQLSP